MFKTHKNIHLSIMYICTALMLLLTVIGYMSTKDDMNLTLGILAVFILIIGNIAETIHINKK